MLTIVAVRAIPPATIEADLSDGKTLTIDATAIIGSSGYESLIAPDQFAAVVVSDWGHGIEWPAIDQGLSIKALIRLAREQAGTAFPTADFNTWMKRNELTLTSETARTDDPSAPMNTPTYEQDFHAWSQQQADLLRGHRAVILEHEAIPKAYRLARLLAVKETNLEESTFPEVCPYSLQETSDTGFYPS